MAANQTLRVLLIATALVAACLGQGATNSRSDRITQAISASGDAIAASVASGNVRGATTKAKAFATLATRENAKASDFGRRLQQGATNSRAERISQALSASEDAIATSVTSGDVKGATNKAKAFAVLATREATRASDFGRRLQQGATNSRAERISQALSASEDAIATSVSNGDVKGATNKAKAFAVLATREATKASDFGRRLQQGATNSRAGRISQAITASEDAIATSVTSGDVKGATNKAKAFAVLATREATKASDFGRKMLSGVSNERSDRIAQALSASSESIGAAVSGRSAVNVATQKSKAFATLAGRDGTAASAFGGN